jgi:hypothetical protein
MALGFDTYEDNREFEKKGLTGDVRRYTTAKMEFPCFILCSSEEHPIQMHSIDALRRMFPTSKVYDETIANSLIHIYFNQGDRTAKLGCIQPGQVKTFLRLFDGCDLDCFLNSEKQLTGMYMYILSN